MPWKFHAWDITKVPYPEILLGITYMPNNITEISFMLKEETKVLTIVVRDTHSPHGKL